MEAPRVQILSKPEFFQVSFLQFLINNKLQSTCEDHFFAGISSAGQMKFIPFTPFPNKDIKN